MKALVTDGRVLEYRQLEWAEIPPHKRHLWRDVVEVDPPPVPTEAYTMTRVDTVGADRVVRSWQITPKDLAIVKADLKARIDADAETARLKYITVGAGQTMEYLEVAEESLRFAATGGAGVYPMLQASVDAGEAQTLADAAALVNAREQGWTMTGAAIRRIRLQAKMAVTAAADVDAAYAAAQVVWP